MTRRMLAGGMIVLVAALGIGLPAALGDRQDDEAAREARRTFHNPIAQEGRIRHARALREAAGAYRQAVIDAHRAYYRDLREALAAARTNRNGEEIAKLSAEMDRIQADADRLQAEDDQASGYTQSYEIFANRDWQPVEKVRQGEVLAIKAQGAWRLTRLKNARDWGPEGAANGIGRLMGRIGQQQFEIGAGNRVIVEQDGILEMRANDTDFTDNSGSLNVTLTIRPGRR